MAVPAVALKVLGGTVAVVGTAGTGYLIWNNVSNTGLLKEDNEVLEKVKKFDNITWSSSNEASGTNTTSSAITNSQIKLTLTTDTNTKSDQTVILNISPNGSESGAKITDTMKSWECSVKGKSSKISNDEKINLKKSFGVTSDSKITKEQKINSISKFIKSCAYYGDRKAKVSEDTNKKLSREINLGNKISFNEFF